MASRVVAREFSGIVKFVDSASGHLRQELLKSAVRMNREMERLVKSLPTQKGGRLKSTQRALSTLDARFRDIDKMLRDTGYTGAMTSYLSTEPVLAARVKRAWNTSGLPVGFRTVDEAAFRSIAGASFDDLANVGREGLRILRDDMRAAITGERNVDSLGRRLREHLFGTDLKDRAGRGMFSHAMTIADTSLSQLQRSMNERLGQQAGITKWEYVGGTISTTRDFCRNLNGAILTRAEIDKLDNGQMADVFITGGGWNCRHQWLPVLEDLEPEPEVAAEMLSSRGPNATTVARALTPQSRNAGIEMMDARRYARQKARKAGLTDDELIRRGLLKKGGARKASTGTARKATSTATRKATGTATRKAATATRKASTATARKAATATTKPKPRLSSRPRSRRSLQRRRPTSTPKTAYKPPTIPDVTPPTAVRKKAPFPHEEPISPRAKMPHYDGVSIPISDAERARIASVTEARGPQDFNLTYSKRFADEDAIGEIQSLFDDIAAGGHGALDAMFELSEKTKPGAGFFNTGQVKEATEARRRLLEYIAANDNRARGYGDLAAQYLFRDYNIDRDWRPGARIPNPTRALAYAKRDFKAVTGQSFGELSAAMEVPMANPMSALRQMQRNVVDKLQDALTERGLRNDYSTRARIIAQSKNRVSLNAAQGRSRAPRPRRGAPATKLSEDIEELVNVLPDDVIQHELLTQVSFVVERGQIRASANDVANYVRLSAQTPKGTTWHEFGHHIEFRNTLVQDRIEHWFQGRIQGESLSLIAQTDGEMGFRDGFFHHYVGKVYGENNRPQFGRTEVMSMGLQAFADPTYFAHAVTKDPDHLALIWGILTGA